MSVCNYVAWHSEIIRVGVVAYSECVGSTGHYCVGIHSVSCGYHATNPRIPHPTKSLMAFLVQKPEALSSLSLVVPLHY
eukprot:3550974-Rhodomonas_salina.1